MKKIPKYLETSVWNKEEISDPYQIIAEFFSAASLIDYRKDIKKIIHFSFSDYTWKKDNPADIFYRFGQLEKVINAAYLINKEEKESAVDVSLSNIFNPNLYCGLLGGHTEWDYFPRMLSFKEFKNPYLVFHRFFEYKKLAEWKELLKEFSEHIFYTHSVERESMNSYDCLTTYHHLIKLVEAVHLIDVREINHVGGHIKNRMPKKSSY